VNDDPQLPLCLDRGSRRREYGVNLFRLAGRCGVDLAAVSVDLRFREAGRQNLLKHNIFRDLVKRDVSAEELVEFRPDGHEGWKPAQLILQLRTVLSI